MASDLVQYHIAAFQLNNREKLFASCLNKTKQNETMNKCKYSKITLWLNLCISNYVI